MNESTSRNIRVQDRYDELMRIGRHGHYETMFQVVREETESLRQQLADMTEAYAKVTERIHMVGGYLDQISDIQKREAMLREFVKLLRDYIPASAVGNMTVQQALAATNDLKEQGK